MASPQKENGYTAIANELLEALILSGLTGTELTICLFVLRQTYGFRKKKDAISISQFVKHTTYSRRGIIDCLNSLQNKKILLCQKHGFRSINTWEINKDYTKWVVNQRALVKYSALVQKNVSTSEPECTPLVNQSAHTKEIPKEIIQKKENFDSKIRKQTLDKLKQELIKKKIIH